MKGEGRWGEALGRWRAVGSHSNITRSVGRSIHDIRLNEYMNSNETRHLLFWQMGPGDSALAGLGRVVVQAQKDDIIGGGKLWAAWSFSSSSYTTFQSLESSYLDESHWSMYMCWLVFWHLYSCCFQSILRTYNLTAWDMNVMRFECDSRIWTILIESLLYWSVVYAVGWNT